MRYRPLEERLWEKVDKTATCWNWLGCCTTNGYGIIRYVNTMRVVHRIVYELLVGAVPEGLDLDHLCRNRSCCNPAHLEPVTRTENMRRSPLHNAAKTQCPQGHPYPPYAEGVKRSCRTCTSRQNREYRSAKKLRPGRQSATG